MAVQKIPFTLFAPFENGKQRTFKFDTNALADFEQEVGMGFPTLMASRAVFAATRALTWCGLKHGDRSLTIPRVGELIQLYLDSGGVITDILEQSMKAAVDQGALKHLKSDTDEEQEPEAIPQGGSEGNGPKPMSEPAS
jgi:hypothetical protein